MINLFFNLVKYVFKDIEVFVIIIISEYDE